MTHRRIGIAAALAVALFTGACSDGGGGGGPTPLACEGPVVQCGVACVDVLTDGANCGVCGRTCATGSTCTNGSCVAPPASCGTGFQRCDGHCTSVAADEANCGACGNACAAGDLCVSGVCGPTCTPGAPTRCGAVCMNLQTDDANCGTCGHPCDAGFHCRAGVCSDACALYETKCGGGACARPGLDDANCGACGVSCDAGEVCSAGACVATCSATLGLPGLPMATVGAGNYGPDAMAAGDLDGDGDPDFAFATGSSIIVLKNLGGGSFAPPETIALGAWSVADVAIANLTGDSDGKLDVAATASSDAAEDLVILLNDGSGGFAAPVRYDTAPGVSSAGPTGIAVADFDGDAKLDVAVANEYAANVAVFLNQGAGVFPTTPTAYAVGSSGYEWIAAGDLGGDGKPDLALAGSSILVLTNAGNGTFGTAVSYPPYPAEFSVSPERIGIADVDGDGRKDLAFVERGVPSSSATVLWNAATSPFTTRTQVGLGEPTSYTMTLADLDADGKLDVVVPRYGDGTVAVARNLGARTFGAAASYPVGSNPKVAAVAVLDADGKPDVAVPRGNHLVILQGNGDGTFVTPLRHQLGMGVTTSRLADLNGDGHLDVVAVARQESTLGYALGSGDGTFGTPVITSVPGYPMDVAVGDLTGDGRPEIVVSKPGDVFSGANRGLGVFVNDGSGAFADEVLYAMSTTPDEVVFADLNEDGQLDVVANLSSLVDVRLGNGDGTLAAGYGLTLPYTIAALAVADLDGDGKQDLVASVLDGSMNWLLVFRNKGGATIGERFGSSQTAKVLTANYGFDLVIADVDRDGRADVLLAEGSHGLGVYLNLGSGLLAARVGYGAWANDVAVSDLDGDRNLDVLAYGGSSGEFSLLRGEANGTFAAPLLYATTGGAPMAGDLNGDARVDVATMGASMGVHLTTCR
jgi:hypothetical protein